MFGMREFVMKTITDLTRVKPKHEIRELALGWYSKGVLTEDDIATIEGMLPSYGSTLEEAQATRQALNKQALADWLSSNPLKWKDGRTYGITLEDQVEMGLAKDKIDVKTALGKEIVVKWHDQKKQCHEMSLQDFLLLCDEIGDIVSKAVEHQESIKASIYAAQSVESVKAIPIDYSNVIQENEGIDDVG